MTPEHEMSETSITFKCPEELADLVGRVAFDLDVSKSEVIRACILIGHKLVQDVRGVERLRIEDIRSLQMGNKNKIKPE